MRLIVAPLFRWDRTPLQINRLRGLRKAYLGLNARAIKNLASACSVTFFLTPLAAIHSDVSRYIDSQFGTRGGRQAEGKVWQVRSSP
jgi:hypothetical protein